MRSLFAQTCTLLAFSTLALLGGCQVGPRAENFPYAQNPQGIKTSLLFGESRFEGELLEVRENEMVVLGEDRVLFLVPFTAIQRGTFDRRRHLLIERGAIPSPEHREQLRLLSRFPQGIDESLEKRLLEAYGQTELQRRDSI